MKLSREDTKKLKDLLAVCAVADIDSIIIESGLVRGANESKTCAIISRNDVPVFPQKMGLSRLSSLRSRLDLFDSADATVDARETERGEISQLEISSSRSKAQFRCTSSVLIKAPSNINDTGCWSIWIKKDEARSILDAIKVMGAKNLIISIARGVATFKISDASNDTFSIQLETSPAVDTENNAEDESTVVSYTTDVFASIIRAVFSYTDTACIKIGQRGSAQINVHGHVLTVLPQINEEEE